MSNERPVLLARTLTQIQNQIDLAASNERNPKIDAATKSPYRAGICAALAWVTGTTDVEPIPTEARTEN